MASQRCLALPLLAALMPGAVGAVEPGETERTVIVGLGAAVDFEVNEGIAHVGGNFMVEYEAIEGWLELEVGVSVLSAPRGGLQVPVDLLVKKPFTLTRNLEVMLGLGPELVYVSGRSGGTFGGIEFAADLMFWPTQHFGFWIEPSYDVVFQRAASQGLGCTGGLIVGW